MLKDFRSQRHFYDELILKRTEHLPQSVIYKVLSIYVKVNFNFLTL